MSNLWLKGAACAAVFFLVAVACTEHQGRVPPLDARATYLQSRDMMARGDVVAGSHLVERLLREHPGSIYGILGTLERFRVGIEVIETARVGALSASRLPAVDLCER